MSVRETRTSSGPPRTTESHDTDTNFNYAIYDRATPADGLTIEGKNVSGDPQTRHTISWKLAPAELISYTNYEVKLKTFIPAPIVQLKLPGIVGAAPLPIPGMPPIPASALEPPPLGGNDRTFSYHADGNNAIKFLQRIVVSLDPALATPSVEDATYAFGSTKTYARNTALKQVAGKPWWWFELDQTNPTYTEHTIVRTPQNSMVSLGAYASLNTVPLQLHGSAALAATDPTLAFTAPTIDFAFRLRLRINPDTLVPEYQLHGIHDGFPAYELYLHGKRIYEFDPEKANTSPLNLVPPMDIQLRDFDWHPIP